MTWPISSLKIKWRQYSVPLWCHYSLSCLSQYSSEATCASMKFIVPLLSVLVKPCVNLNQLALTQEERSGALLSSLCIQISTDAQQGYTKPCLSFCNSMNMEWRSDAFHVSLFSLPVNITKWRLLQPPVYTISALV